MSISKKNSFFHWMDRWVEIDDDRSDLEEIKCLFWRWKWCGSNRWTANRIICGKWSRLFEMKKEWMLDELKWCRVEESFWKNVEDEFEWKEIYQYVWFLFWIEVFDEWIVSTETSKEYFDYEYWRRKRRDSENADCLVKMSRCCESWVSQWWWVIYSSLRSNRKFVSDDFQFEIWFEENCWLEMKLIRTLQCRLWIIKKNVF